MRSASSQVGQFHLGDFAHFCTGANTGDRRRGVVPLTDLGRREGFWINGAPANVLSRRRRVGAMGSCQWA